ncbi:MAG: hypothetical protein GY734_21680 [Herbaspirillum sp.]|uniref:hypothetical protein n=1 Tax=Herbaspirillum sp. TaxID=1890675 RepID=UPI0025832866|nr:hypothetical protein [Herbaspirillum sp.]MCP3658477.1 hypothetical protein [Herbaspirillum sp.]MCP3950087.1 hypothetical protein [Herbaspirillum sp.]MCP4033830.1 hypothetical protein [Herbaspirillum sp.]
MKKEKLEQKLETARQHALSKDGSCLSTEYTNNGAAMLWSCSNPEHKEWSATYKKVVCCGTWCPECSREMAHKKMQAPKQTAEKRLEIAKAHAIARGGVCLTETATHCKEPLKWKCSNNKHPTWTALHDSVVTLNSWCPECGNKQRAESRVNKEALLIAKQYAADMGGQCLSTEYVKARDYLNWKCGNNNHPVWSSWFDTVIRNGYWCPQCAAEKNKSESRARAFFEEFFGKSFPSVRPTWNINPWTGNLLELDGYCKEFNLAFEHDGEHHFELTRGKKPRDLTYQKFKDHQKMKNCHKQGILLINIPIAPHGYRNNFDYMFSNIVKSCEPHGLEFNPTKEQLDRIKEKFNKGD